MNSIQSNSMYNLSSMLLSGRSQMNDMRLAQALAGKNSKPVSSVDKVGSGLSSGDAEFLKSYQSKMTDLLDAANAVAKGEETDKRIAASEDAKVAQVSGKLSDASDSYDIRVDQLASGQINRSQEMQSAGTLPTMSGAMRIKTDKGTFNFNLTAAGTETNKEMLEKFAKEINTKATGVTASVKEKDGKSYLELAGDQTGAANAFTVSGTVAERLGVDTVAQKGQDAVYAVSKNGGESKTMTSASNNITLEAGLTAGLKGVGQTKVSAGVDSANATADAMEKLVQKFNDTLSFLNKNEDRGIGVLRQVKRMVTPPASEKSMELAGITIKKDGTLKLDRETLVKKLNENPTVYKDIVENVARGVKNDAQQGLRTSSASLVGTTQVAQRQSDVNKDPINFMSMYNRSGVYNVANYYAVGALMNINI